MIWTTDKPIVSGWYWFRNAHTKREIFEINRWMIQHRVKEMHGEWAGPLEPPEER